VRSWVSQAMAAAQQDLLRTAWLGGRTGYLSAWSEAKLWAAREVWRSEKEGDFGLQTWPMRHDRTVYAARFNKKNNVCPENEGGISWGFGGDLLGISGGFDTIWGDFAPIT
jgi:hypothetical protein